MLFLFRRGRALRLGAGDAGQHLVKRLFGRHLLGAALVAAVFVLAVAGAATRPQNFLSHQGYDRMVSGAFACGTMVVDVIAESHGVLRSFALPILPRKQRCCLVFMIKSLWCLLHNAANLSLLKDWTAWASPRSWRISPQRSALADLTSLLPVNRAAPRWERSCARSC